MGKPAVPANELPQGHGTGDFFKQPEQNLLFKFVWVEFAQATF